MFHAPDYSHDVSLRLSEVLNDIGVSERIVMKRRRARLLHETLHRIPNRLSGDQTFAYYLGSQSEGTTTIGLHSDLDVLVYCNDAIVIQDWAEWTRGKSNLLMIQDETVPPGYCYLQFLRSDVPLPHTEEYKNYFIKDTRGRILVKNTIIEEGLFEFQQRQGPSGAIQGGQCCTDVDTIVALPFKSWPRPARHWLDQEHATWPTAGMKRYAATSNCFVVGTGSNVSENKDFQWRISTSLAERCLMLNLCITQVRCYILLKMILKTFINIHGQTDITSFMCKTVLLHCITSKPYFVWKESNILNCLTYCLSVLNKCIQCENCPHFIIPENNLMAGKITAENKHRLLEQMSNLIQHTAGSLLRIQTDDLGQRLLLKLNIIHDAAYNAVFSSNNTASTLVNAADMLNTASALGTSYGEYLSSLNKRSLETQNLFLMQAVTNLLRYHADGNLFVQTACRLLAPFFCTTLGCLMTSHHIQHNNHISPQAIRWLSAGINSDIASSRLKFASVFYCIGDMERTASILRDTEERYNIHVVHSICNCDCTPKSYYTKKTKKRGFYKMLTQYNYEVLKYITNFCVRFLPSERNCIPKELQYEMFRSFGEELLHRHEINAWMDWAVVDSIPYLYFLKYKNCGYLQRIQDQRHALNNLILVTNTEPNLGHRDTAWNLLGQCMEQENRLDNAFQCYWKSLNIRQTNNVARVHICKLLAKIISRVN